MYSVRFVTLSLGLVLWVTSLGCGQEGNEDTPPTSPLIEDAFEAEGLTFTEGLVTRFTIDDCERIQNCYGNGPTTPYLLFNLPSATGEDGDLPERTIGAIPRVPEQMRSSYYLSANDALVIVGTTPPAAQYFGFTPYIYTRTNDMGERISIFASIQDTLNHLTISVIGDDPFSQPFALVVTSDRGALEKVSTALQNNGFASNAINSMPLSRDFIRFGNDADSDTLLLLGRMTNFENKEAGNTYLNALPLRFFRVTVETLGDGLAQPARNTRGDGASEHPQYAEVVNTLEAEIVASLAETPYEKIEIQSAATIEALLNGDKCIDDVTQCRGDNGDTTYSAGPVEVGMTESGALTVGPQLDLTLDDNDYFIIYGVNHTATGKSVYSNLGLYTADTRIGVAAIADTELVGSADAYLPDFEDADKLFAYQVRRECGDRPFCLTLSTEFPGIAQDQGIFFICRAYLNPGLTVSAAPAELVPERVILVKVPDGQ